MYNVPNNSQDVWIKALLLIAASMQYYSASAIDLLFRPLCLLILSLVLCLCVFLFPLLLSALLRGRLEWL